MSLKTLFLTKLRNKYITYKDIKEAIYPDLVSLRTDVDNINPSSLSLTWTDYSTTSTIVGWSAGATIVLKYCIIGKLMFVQYNISGTSNSTAVSFTLPNTANGTQGFPTAFITDNSAPLLTNGYTSIVTGTSHVDVYSTGQGAGWTASNLKIIVGSFFIAIN